MRAAAQDKSTRPELERRLAGEAVESMARERIGQRAASGNPAFLQLALDRRARAQLREHRRGEQQALLVQERATLAHRLALFA